MGKFVFKGYGIYFEVSLAGWVFFEKRYNLKEGILTRPQVDEILNDLIRIVCGEEMPQDDFNWHNYAQELFTELNNITKRHDVYLLDEGVDWYYERN